MICSSPFAAGRDPRWWENLRVALMGRSRSVSVSAGEGALELLSTWRPPGDDQAGSPRSVVAARRGAWRCHIEPKQLPATPRPTMQAPPALWLREAHDRPGAAASSHLGGAQHRHRPPRERERDRAERVAEVGEDAPRRDGGHCPALDTAVAPQCDFPERRARFYAPAAPKRPGSTSVPVQTQSPCFPSTSALATRAVRRSRLLDVRGVYRPIVDVEIMMRQLRCRSGFQWA